MENADIYCGVPGSQLPRCFDLRIKQFWEGLSNFLLFEKFGRDGNFSLFRFGKLVYELVTNFMKIEKFGIKCSGFDIEFPGLEDSTNILNDMM